MSKNKISKDSNKKTKPRKKKPQRSTSKLTSPCRKGRGLDIKIVTGSHDGSLYKIIKASPKKDDSNEAYIPFCTYHWHQGLILQGDNYCVRQECKHYKRAYLFEPGFPS